MAYRNWEVIKVSYCEHAGEEVALEAEIAYPATYLPEQAPRMFWHIAAPAAWHATASGNRVAAGPGTTPTASTSSRNNPSKNLCELSSLVA